MQRLPRIFEEPRHDNVVRNVTLPESSAKTAERLRLNNDDETLLTNQGQSIDGIDAAHTIRAVPSAPLLSSHRLHLSQLDRDISRQNVSTALDRLQRRGKAPLGAPHDSKGLMGATQDMPDVVTDLLKEMDPQRNAKVPVKLHMKGLGMDTVAPPREGDKKLTNRTSFGIRSVGHGIAKVYDKATDATHNHEFSAAGALASLAGLYDYRELFVEAVFRAPEKELYKIQDVVKRPFYREPALRHAVIEAAIQGVLAQEKDGAPALVALNNAHHLLAIYLEYLPNEADKFEAGAQNLLQRLNLLLDESAPTVIAAGDPMRQSYIRYKGILAGLCLGAVLRFGENALKKAEKRKHHLVLAINLVGAAISGGPFGGAGPMAAALTAAAEPLARRIFDKKDIAPDLVRLGATLEDAVMGSLPDADAQSFVYQLEKTVRHCGKPY